MSDTLKPIPFFTDSITLIPHSLSSELADNIEKPMTVAQFVERTGAERVGLFATSDHELLIRTRLPDGRELFAQGPEQFPTHH